jgi:hypothetical protein
MWWACHWFDKRNGQLSFKVKEGENVIEKKGIIKNTFPFSPSHITKRDGDLDFYHTMIKMIIVTITTCTEVPAMSKKRKRNISCSWTNVHTFFLSLMCCREEWIKLKLVSVCVSMEARRVLVVCLVKLVPWWDMFQTI